MTWIRTGAALIACSALLAACGGEDDSLPKTEVVSPSTGSTEISDEPVSTEDFIAAGDEICVETFSAVSAAESTETDEADLYDTRANLYAEMVEELQGIGTPEDEEGLDDLYSAAGDLAEANEEAAAAAEDGDETALTAADTDAETALAGFQAAATSYGFEDCGDAAAGLPVDGSDVSVPTVPGDDTTTVPAEPVPTEPVPTEPAPAPVEPAPAPAPAPAPEPVAPPNGGASPPPPAPEPAPTPSDTGGVSPG